MHGERALLPQSLMRPDLVAERRVGSVLPGEFGIECGRSYFAANTSPAISAAACS